MGTRDERALNSISTELMLPGPPLHLSVDVRAAIGPAGEGWPEIIAARRATTQRQAFGRRLIAAAFMAAAIGASADDRVCLVVGVSDGDTLTARCGELGAYEQVKVRLSGIDAPEKRQPFGERSRQTLASLVFQRWARLDCPKTDRYGRSVCSVWVAPDTAPNGPKTLDAGLAMVTQGMAWWYRAYARDQTVEARGQYEFAEQEARAKRAGLWRDVAPVPPWEWRRQH